MILLLRTFEFDEDFLTHLVSVTNSVPPTMPTLLMYMTFMAKNVYGFTAYAGVYECMSSIADCYEEGVTSTRHLDDHPTQCILTRSDIEFIFGGEILNSEQPQSFTCPYCKKMGFSVATLLEHVSAEHTEISLELVCPVCAGLPGGEANTDDFAGHLSLMKMTICYDRWQTLALDIEQWFRVWWQCDKCRKLRRYYNNRWTFDDCGD
uniref:RING-type E3 ubiquitin transferase n=1 Tax=Glossina pallidipes TaxID=7398 RepID=A0A1B0ADE8_GLOPL